MVAACCLERAWRNAGSLRIDGRQEPMAFVTPRNEVIDLGAQLRHVRQGAFGHRSQKPFDLAVDILALFFQIRFAGFRFGGDVASMLLGRSEQYGQAGRG